MTRGNRVEARVPLRLERPVVVLVVAVALFHLANAPAMPLVALEVKALHGTHTQVAAVVFVAQCVMVPDRVGVWAAHESFWTEAGLRCRLRRSAACGSSPTPW